MIPKGSIGPCGVCGGQNWRLAYEGPVRRGTFGEVLHGAIYDCEDCGVGFYPQSPALSPGFYEGAEYRETVGEGSAPESFFQLHDPEQATRLQLLANTPLRGRVVADIGCGAGSFLDTVRGLASQTVGVEPSVLYHDCLRKHGHVVYPDTAAAIGDWRARVDVAVCFSVIEHVTSPVALLKEISALLAPGGRLLISTPNRHDILLESGSAPYKSFFYRAVHLYYFDCESLKAAGAAAGFSSFEPVFAHRFNFGNFLTWLRDGRPEGNRRSSVLGERFDRLWKAELESSGHSDYLFAWLRR